MLQSQTSVNNKFVLSYRISETSIISEKHGHHVYETSSRTRGVVKIINIDNVPNYRERLGSQNDVESLRQLFGNMGFCVDVEPSEVNSKQGIEKALHEFINDKRLETADTAILFIMGHGNAIKLQNFFLTKEGSITGKIYHYEIEQLFMNDKCKMMIHKPKIIFFQMCRGDKLDEGVMLNSVEFDGGSMSQNKLAISTDLLICHSTIQGYKSVRYPEKGSLFIQTLCKVFMQVAHKYDVCTLMDIVYRDMSKEEVTYNEKTILQCGEYIKRTFGICFFNPGIYLDENKVLRYFNTDDKVSVAGPSRANDNMELETKSIRLSKTRKSPLHKAALAGNLAACRMLIEGGCIINITDEEGCTPLHYAAKLGCFELCLELVKHGATINDVDNHGHTAAYYADLMGHKEIFDLIV